MSRRDLVHLKAQDPSDDPEIQEAAQRVTNYRLWKRLAEAIRKNLGDRAMEAQLVNCPDAEKDPNKMTILVGEAVSAALDAVEEIFAPDDP